MANSISILLIIGSAVMGPLQMPEPAVTIDDITRFPRGSDIQLSLVCDKARKDIGAIYYNANVMPENLPLGQRMARNQLDQGWWTLDKSQRVECIRTPAGYKK